MKKIILAVFLAGLFACNAQENGFHPSVRLGFGYMGWDAPDGTRLVTGGDRMYGTDLNIDADLWKVKGNLSAGLHFAIGAASYGEVLTATSIEQHDCIGLHFGIDVYEHVLPLLGATTEHWDVALRGSIGSYWQKMLTPQAEYCFGIVGTYYPFSHLGIFAECDWGKFAYGTRDYTNLYIGNTMLKAGLSFRF